MFETGNNWCSGWDTADESVHTCDVGSAVGGEA